MLENQNKCLIISLNFAVVFFSSSSSFFKIMNWFTRFFKRKKEHCMYVFCLFELLKSYFSIAVAAAAKLPQLCLTLCNPIDGNPPGSTVPGILQARTLEWVAISFSNVWKWKVKLLSRVWLFMTPWTAAYQAPLSMGFSRQEYWSGLPLPSPIFP